MKLQRPAPAPALYQCGDPHNAGMTRLRHAAAFALAAFATMAGMLVYPQVCSQEYAEPRGSRKLTGTDGYIARVGNWLRTSF